MNRETQDNVLLLVGAVLLQTGLTDLHLRYVKPEMQPLVVLTGLGLVLAGALGVLRTIRSEADEEHDHPAPAAAWLLVLPLLVMGSLSPPALGAYTAARADTTIEVPTFSLPPLPEPRDGAVDLTLTDYYSHVLYDAEVLRGATIRLTGFATPVDGEWYLTRMALSCCAADGRPVKVLADGAGSRPVPAADTWLEVIGTYSSPRVPAGGTASVPAFRVQQLRQVPPPADPYED